MKRKIGFLSWKSINHEGELKNPFKNKNKHIRSKGPTPNTKRTSFAFLGFVFFSPTGSTILEITLVLDFLAGIPQRKLLKTIVAMMRRSIYFRKFNRDNLLKNDYIKVKVALNF